MSLITIFLIIVGVIILLYILNNYMITECFDNINPEEIRSNAYKQIEIIKDNYQKLKELYKKERAEINEILDAKKQIKDAVNRIDILLINSYDRYKLSDLYNNELLPILDKPKDLTFFDIIENMKVIIDNGLNNKVSPLYSEVVSYLQIDNKLYWELERLLDRDVRELLYSQLERQLNNQLYLQMEHGKFK